MFIIQFILSLPRSATYWLGTFLIRTIPRHYVWRKIGEWWMAVLVGSICLLATVLFVDKVVVAVVAGGVCGKAKHTT